MGVKDGFMGAPTMTKVALVLLLVANLFSWIAFTTTSWGYIDNAVGHPGYGLWRTCGEAVSSCHPVDGTRLDWYAAFQAFGIFGWAGLSLALLLLVLSALVDTCKGNGDVSKGAMICCFVGAVCWLVAVILFAAKWPDYIDDTKPRADDDFGFSFALAIVALVFAVIAGILIIVGGKGGGTSPA